MLILTLSGGLTIDTIQAGESHSNKRGAIHNNTLTNTRLKVEVEEEDEEEEVCQHVPCVICENI